MIKQNQEEFDYCNITKWQTNNLGENAHIVVLDECLPYDWLLKESNIEVLFKEYMKESDIKNGHGSVITSVGFEIAPKAKVTYIPYNSLKGSEWTEPLLRWFEDNHNSIDIISMSISWNFAVTPKVKVLKKIAEKYKIPFIVASGNDGTDKMGYPAICDGFISVGATTKLTSVTHYSQGGDKLKIVAPSYIWYYTSDKYGEDPFTKDIFAQTGTSISTPFVAYGLALYLSWRNRSNMKKLNVFEVEELLKDNAEDLYKKGHDNRSGYGLFILPEKIETQEEGSETMFTDINDRYTEAKEAIEWAVAEGLMDGYAGQRQGEFGPTDPVTREQLAIILKRQHDRR